MNSTNSSAANRPGNIPPNEAITEINLRVKEVRRKVKNLSLPSSPIMAALDDVALTLSMMATLMSVQERYIKALEKRCYRLENPESSTK